MKKFLAFSLTLLIGLALGWLLRAPHKHIAENTLKSEEQPSETASPIINLPIIDSHLMATGPQPLVTLVWFGEYGDPLSQKLAAQIKRIQEKANFALTISYRHAPLTAGRSSLGYAVAAEAAARQDKFWPFHDVIFTHQADSLPPIDELIEDMGLDGNRFQEDMANTQLAAKVYRDLALVHQLSITVPPALFINGQKHPFPTTDEDLLQALNQAFAAAQEMVSQGVAADQLYDTIQLRATKPLNLSTLTTIENRQQVIPRSDFPTFGGEDPLLWIYYFSTFGGPFTKLGNERINQIRRQYGDKIKIIFLPYAKDQLPASHLAAACAYWALEQGNFQEVLPILQTLPASYSIDDFYNLKNGQGDTLCPPQPQLEQYHELVGAAGLLKQTMQIAADPALLINGINIPIIREATFFDSLIVQELALAESLKANGLHNLDLLVAITRTPPSQY